MGLLFMATDCRATPLQKNKHKKGIVHAMTVLEVQPTVKGADTISVTFRKSQRIYRLPKKSKAVFLKLLKESEQKHTPVMVWRIKEESDVIISVERP